MVDNDSFERTVATLVLFGVWASIVLGPMFVPDAEPPAWELQTATTAVAFLVLGRMWNIDVERVLNRVTIATDPSRDDESD